MKDTSVSDCKVIDLGKINHRNGNITVVENNKKIPFDTKRVYYLYDIPGGATRGSHAHRTIYQLLVAVSGSFEIILEDNKDEITILLNSPNIGLLIVPGIWRKLKNFSSGSVCLTLASDIYNESDYIRDYAEFKEYKGV